MRRPAIIALAIALMVCLALPAAALVGSRRVLMGSGPFIFLSNSTVLSTATVGTTIGSLSVIGATGSFTFTLTSNPGGLFSISGNLLQVAGVLSPGTDPIKIQAANGAGVTIINPFTITVTTPGGGCSPGAPTGQMDFSLCSNVGIVAAVMP